MVEHKLLEDKKEIDFKAKKELVTLPMLDYNKNSKFQEGLNKPVYKFLTESALHLSEWFPNEVELADFGCSHGENSMACIKAILDGYLEVKGPISVSVHLNDLPSNDFDEVTKCLTNPEISYQEHKIFKINNESNYTTDFKKISFYEKMLPDNSLLLGICLNSLHWMEKPVRLERSIFPRSTMTSPEEREILVKEARDQLTKFLHARYQELKPKGRLILSLISESTKVEPFDEVWHDYIKTKGLQSEQLSNVYIPIYFRPIEEINSVLKKSENEFKIISRTPQIFKPDNFTRDVFKSLFFNVLVKGVKATHTFSNYDDVVAFVEGFIQFFPSYVFKFTNQTELLVLEKQ